MIKIVLLRKFSIHLNNTENEKFNSPIRFAQKIIKYL